MPSDTLHRLPPGKMGKDKEHRNHRHFITIVNVYGKGFCGIFQYLERAAMPGRNSIRLDFAVLS
jgi:hypothetical protein